MKISIAYAVPGRQILLPLTVPDGSTIRSAIEQSGIPAVIPLEMCHLGWQESLAQLATLVEPDIPG